MAQERTACVRRGHADTVIYDLYLCFAGIFQVNLDRCTPGVDGVLHQLLENRGRTLHHFPGCNLRSDGIWELEYAVGTHRRFSIDTSVSSNMMPNMTYSTVLSPIYM